MVGRKTSRSYSWIGWWDKFGFPYQTAAKASKLASTEGLYLAYLVHSHEAIRDKYNACRGSCIVKNLRSKEFCGIDHLNMKTTPLVRAFRNGLLASFLVVTALPATAQLDCSDLSVGHLYYAAFTDTSFELNMLNGSGTQINYPWFSLVDSNQDTVARSFGSFFVLPTGSVLNHVPLTAGSSLPSSSFTGEVVLHYAAFPGDSTCVFPVTNLDLCPPAPCTELVLYVYQLDTIGDPWLFWTMRDSANTIVGSGDVQSIDGDPSAALDTLCLPPGNYELEIEQSPFADPGTFVATLMRRSYDLDGPHVQFTGTGVLPFTFFPACVDGTNAIAEATLPALQWSLNGNSLSIGDPAGSALGVVEVFSAHGTRIAQRHVMASTTTLDLSGQARGVYILRAGVLNGRATQRFILYY